jgi:hypothetical protein
MFLRAYNNFYRANYAYLEAYLIKVVDIVVVNAVLSYYILYKYKLLYN